VNNPHDTHLTTKYLFLNKKKTSLISSYSWTTIKVLLLVQTENKVLLFIFF